MTKDGTIMDYSFLIRDVRQYLESGYLVAPSHRTVFLNAVQNALAENLAPPPAAQKEELKALAAKLRQRKAY